MNRKQYTTELIDLLYFCEQYSAGKKVLDCGAGGSYPKLALFGDKDYELYGIDSDDDALQSAHQFAQLNQIEMNFKKADIRSIPYPDNHFDVVYSYNTIFHMKKIEIKKAVDEIIRILKPGGIGFINFIDINDDIHKTDTEDEPGEYVSSGDGYDIIHTLLSEDECEAMLSGVKILEKQQKYITRLNIDQPYKYGFLDYFFQKES
ncbi:class I SAM-dependent methyltransferase [Candidatus Lokiarchaeum ossiferum]|uniref:class I SAM-dependent methyltransferase n=1 Tax=Candidatus Lokiarchaeum ossiferum TaxID=2951803 RepID=UPI00352BE522